MCLDLNENQLETKVAKTDIKCYKFLYQGDDLITPYMMHTVEMGSTYITELDEPNVGLVGNSVERGLHSFTTLHGLIGYVRNRVRRKRSGYTMLLVECIIPKGSEYYEGNFNNTKSYASDTLKYNRFITETESIIPGIISYITNIFR